MNLENISEMLKNLINWEESDKDTYELESELLESLSDFRPNDFVKVIVGSTIYIVFLAEFEEEEFETKPYYYSKLETNIPLENTNPLFVNLAQLLNK